MHVLLILFAIRNVEISNYFHISRDFVHQNAPEMGYLRFTSAHVEDGIFNIQAFIISTHST